MNFGMKPRDTKDYAWAITRIMGHVGTDVCAAAVGKSEDLIRKWANPDHDCYPNLYQAEALDRAFQEAGYGEGPIAKLFSERVGHTVPQVGDPISEYMDIDTVKGHLSELFSQALNKTGPGGKDITPNEYHAISDALCEMQKEITEFDQSMRLAASVPAPGEPRIAEVS